MRPSVAQRANALVTRKVSTRRVRSHLTAPVASITFDDFPKSAWTAGRPILDRHGAKATYYTAGAFCGRTVDGIDYYDAEDLRAVVAEGHEVGCHTFAHHDVKGVSGRLLAEDFDRNAAFARDVLGDYRLSSFAYPFGEASVRSKLEIGPRFSTCRGIRKGVNGGRIDLAQLKAVPLEHRAWSLQMIEDAVNEAARTTGWLVLFTHDIAEAPTPFGATPAMLDHALKALAAAKIEVLPVKHALARAVFG